MRVSSSSFSQRPSLLQVLALAVLSTTTHAWVLQHSPFSTTRTLAAVPQTRSPLSRLPLPRTISSSSALSVTTLYEPPTSSSSSSDDNTNSSNNDDNNDDDFPQLGEDGIYRIDNKAQHQAFLQAHKDELVILKIFAPWCRACKGLEPKFVQIAHDETYAKELPTVFAQLSIQHNKEFVKSLGVLALPTVQFYVGGALHDNFPCGPSKVPILKRKLAQLIQDHVDPQTRRVKESSIEYYQNQLAEQQQEQETDDQVVDGDKAGTIASTATKKATTVVANATEAIGASAITETAQPPKPTAEERRAIISSIPYFSEMSLADADAVLDKARLLTFEPKSIIMREGKPGRTFYILKQGEVEICQATTFAYDPLVVPSSYLGTVINRLQAGEYFGERAIITGEPRAASIRATDQPVTCWALDQDDFPHSSPLSGRTRGLQSDVQLDNVNDKYGVNTFDDIYEQEALTQVRQSQTASQIRGSVNTPEMIRGVDTDDDENVDGVAFDYSAMNVPPTSRSTAESTAGVKVSPGNNDAIFTVLRRFQLIRQVSQCFDYIVETNAQWGTEGIRKRRQFLVKRLSPSQRADVRETFGLIDASGDGLISLLELSRVMESIGETKSDEQLMQVMSNASLDGRPEMNLQDFEGLMAEAEFYNLFRDVFSTLDTKNSGFVKAGDLDRVLNGVRDLISDDRKSLIDVEDADVLIDYERFSRMLLGTALI